MNWIFYNKTIAEERSVQFTENIQQLSFNIESIQK